MKRLNTVIALLEDTLLGLDNVVAPEEVDNLQAALQILKDMRDEAD